MACTNSGMTTPSRLSDSEYFTDHDYVWNVKEKECKVHNEAMG